jgi:hypothetical protein
MSSHHSLKPLFFLAGKVGTNKDGIGQQCLPMDDAQLQARKIYVKVVDTTCNATSLCPKVGNACFEQSCEYGECGIIADTNAADERRSCDARSYLVENAICLDRFATCAGVRNYTVCDAFILTLCFLHLLGLGNSLE